MARRLVDRCTRRLSRGDFSDSYRERVQQLIEAKARGETPQLEPERPRDQHVDLMPRARGAA